jgi:broad specificity phosphatase PhoE
MEKVTHMKLYVVRHGESEHNVQELRNDDPSHHSHLTANGRLQAQASAEKLAKAPFEIIFVSEFVRTQQTAAIINAAHEKPIVVDARLNERRTGFEGRTVVEFRAAIPRHDFNSHLPGYEAFVDLQKRVLSFLDELKTQSYAVVLIVTHQHIAQILYGHMHHLTNDELVEYRIHTGDVLEFDI